MARVFVAMSGGVDSSVAAALLLEQGHDVTGITMQLWPSSDAEGGCCSVSAVRDARRVCDMLGIPHYQLNYREIFEREVVAPIAAAYARGETPNPCIVCNDRVKFSDLLAKVSAQGAEYLATGHYARIVATPDGARLGRGVDISKDQSYFLYRMTPTQLDRTMFPVGELHKTEVRAIAERFGLHIAKKAESQETCFAVDGAYAPVVGSREPGAAIPGDIVTEDGAVVGRHEGIANHTVGQRKGLGIGGLAEPLFVIAIDAPTNRVVVGPKERLAVRTLVAGDVVWHGARDAAVQAMVRYRMEPVSARAVSEGDTLKVAFDVPVMGVAPGQSVVCYDGDLVTGGGVIRCVN